MSRVAAFLVAIACAAPVHAQTAYFVQIEDLPVAPGLEESGDRFELAENGVRVLGSWASGRAEAEQVRSYYQSALPALGWAISIGGGGENETIYLRGREQLSLSFHQRGQELRLQALLFSRLPPHD